MNILKSHYSEILPIGRYLPQLDANGKELFRGIYLTKKMTAIQESQWRELLGRPRTDLDQSTFLFNLLLTCQLKNRANILLRNIDFKSKKLSKVNFHHDEYLRKNSLLEHICLSKSWFERRTILCDDALVYLLSEFLLIECLSRKRQLFIQISGTNETFYVLPYYITRTNQDKQRAEIRVKKINTRKRTIQFHLHATRQGQQAHLTDSFEKLIERHLMHYHVSKFERFDIHHSLEKCSHGEMIVEAMITSEFSRRFFASRPKDEVDQIREKLTPIFEQFRTNHQYFYLRRRSRLPFSYTQHHIPEPTATLDQLIPLTTPLALVQNFLRRWLTVVFPIEFFGCQFNRHLFIGKMLLMIRLPRIQQYSLGDALRKFQFRKCQWSQTSSPLLSQLYICHLIYFLSQYVLTLIRSYFYVTEASSPSHPLVLVFYRHKIWHVIQQKSRKELIEKACCPTVEQEFVRNSNDIRYLWKIRFVPKTSSIRYLACAQEPFNSKENITQLKYTNEILKYLRRQNPQLMGIATFNREEMHRRWQDYCRSAPKDEGENMVYFLRSDVSNFYDSINLDYLDRALVEFLENCHFDYNLYIHTIFKTQYRNGRFIRQKTIYWVGKESEYLGQIMSDDTKHTSNGIFHDMIIHDNHVEIYNKEKLLKYIRAQLFNSYLYTRHHTISALKTHRRTIGINHGLRTASMLGQIYLNQIDRDIDFSPLDDEFAVRHEDDLLIISPHRYRLRRIKAKMTSKLNELHHLNNPLKTKTNIRYKSPSKLRPVEYWGSLVDIQSREILVSMNVHEPIGRKVNHLTIKITRETGLHLRHSLLNALCLRSHSYYFDRLYTSEKTLIKNFYFLTCYFLRRLHSMFYRFAEFYSKSFCQTKTLFLFRTLRAALSLLMKKSFNNNSKSKKTINQCKYVFFHSTIRLIRMNRNLFEQDLIIKRFKHMIRKLKYLTKKRKFHLKTMMRW